MLLIVQALSEAVKTGAKSGEVRAKRPLQTRTPKHEKMMREVLRERGGAAYRECGYS